MRAETQNTRVRSFIQAKWYGNTDYADLRDVGRFFLVTGYLARKPSII
ncbi:MAG: hypothetical protein AAFO82_12035 [Bacteroidota bacterium]